MPEQAPRPAVVQESHNHDSHGHSHEADLGSSEHACSVHCNHGESILAADSALESVNPLSLDAITETSINAPKPQEHIHGGHVCDSHCSHGESKMLSDDVFSSSEKSAPTTALSLSESTQHNPAEQHHSHNTTEASKVVAPGSKESNEAPATVEQVAQTTPTTEVIPEQAVTNQENSATGNNKEHSPALEATIDSTPSKTEAGDAHQRTSSSDTSISGKEQPTIQSKPASESIQSAPARIEAAAPMSESADFSSSTSAGPEMRSGTTVSESIETKNSKLDIEAAAIRTDIESAPAAPIETNQGAVPTAAEIEQSDQATELANSLASEAADSPIEAGLADAQAKEMLLDDVELATIARENDTETSKADAFEEYAPEDAATDSLEDELSTIDVMTEGVSIDTPEQTTLSSERAEGEAKTTEVSSSELHTVQDIEAIFTEAEAITAANEISDTAVQTNEATANQQIEATTTPEEEVFDIEQIMSNIEQLYAEEATASSEIVPESAIDIEEITDSIPLTPVEAILGSSAGAESQTEEQLPKIVSEALPSSNAEEVAALKLDQQADAIAREIHSRLEIHRSQNQINTKTVLPLLEKYNLSLNDQQLEKLLALLRSDSDEQTAEFITGLLKLRHIEYQQEFLSSSKQAFSKQLTQKHHRLLGVLRKLFPALLVSPEN